MTVTWKTLKSEWWLVSLKIGGGERTRVGMEVSCTSIDSKMNGLVSHAPDIDLPKNTLKSKVSAR